jgi:hypothetical protein
LSRGGDIGLGVPAKAWIDSYQGWVIEGCYTGLIEVVLSDATDIIILNLPVVQCRDNAKNRPWESHKYVSRQAQDANVPMLLDWIAQYAEREDTFFHAFHRALVDQYRGEKTEFARND